MSTMTQANTTTGTINTTSATDTVLVLVRLAVGIPFIFHGASIALGAFGGPGLHGFSSFTHMPLPIAALVGYGELLGGLGILFGVLTRIASTGILIIMLGAIFMVHLPHGYDLQKQGIEYPLTHVFLTIALIIAGPGAYSALSLIGRRPSAPALQ
jgi:putative oxidoreductase